MPIDAICNSCLKPVQIDYGYDRIIIHQCPLCKSGVIIILPMPAPSTVESKALAAA